MDMRRLQHLVETPMSGNAYIRMLRINTTLPQKKSILDQQTSGAHEPLAETTEGIPTATNASSDCCIKVVLVVNYNA